MISIVLLLAVTTVRAAPMPPPMLFIAREPLVAGRENEYQRIEQETARLSAKLGCPHPYLAMESLSGPKEIWWFNGFETSEDQERVGAAYEKNAPLSAMLNRNRARKAPFTGKVVTFTAQFRPELGGGSPWIPGYARYLVIRTARDRPSGAGTVFQAADGTFLVFSPAKTRRQADELAAATPGAIVVLTRPSLSFPAKEWIAADSSFWRRVAPSP